jgi:3-isopropylmalate/(R)-2-methylmalate dehydratase small subunit
VIARSFGRIFYRNCINNALPAITCPEAVDALEKGDEVEVDFKAGEIRSAKGTFTFPPLPEAVQGIFEAGGLIPYTRRQLGITE